MAIRPTEIQEHLAGLDYPADRSDIVSHARGKGASDEILDILEEVDDRTYDSPADLMKSIGEQI